MAAPLDLPKHYVYRTLAGLLHTSEISALASRQIHLPYACAEGLEGQPRELADARRKQLAPMPRSQPLPQRLATALGPWVEIYDAPVKATFLFQPGCPWSAGQGSCQDIGVRVLPRRKSEPGRPQPQTKDLRSSVSIQKARGPAGSSRLSVWGLLGRLHARVRRNWSTKPASPRNHIRQSGRIAAASVLPAKVPEDFVQATVNITLLARLTTLKRSLSPLADVGFGNPRQPTGHAPTINPAS